MTAHAMTGDREKCLEAGMNGYVAKPVDPLALADQLEKWLVRTKPAETLPQKPAESSAGKTDAAAVRIYDRPAFLHRLMGDENLVATVIAGFLDDMPKQLAMLKAFIKNGQTDQAQSQAHKIKGAAGNVTGQALQKTAAAMEQAGKAGDVDTLTALMPELEQRFIQLKKVMES
jgi:HPt (histidine-containing phosphotransfer) domain-containing protein